MSLCQFRSFGCTEFIIIEAELDIDLRLFFKPLSIVNCFPGGLSKFFNMSSVTVDFNAEFDSFKELKSTFWKFL